MEYLIAKLIQDFEQGKINRRQLIRALTVTTAAAFSVTTPPAAAGTGFTATSVNHISYEATDYTKIRDFYSNLLGMTPSADNGKQCVLSFGATKLIARTGNTTAPRIDHIAYTVGNWDKKAVEAELQRRGLRRRLDTGGGQESFHIEDPNGFDVQISSGPLARG